MNYKDFLETKKHSIGNFGIEAKFIPDQMFDFQKYVTEYSVKKGRCAVFLDTGLGKTIIELAVATNYLRHTNKPVLIITPLAVAFQFLKEAEKFGIDDIRIDEVLQYKESKDEDDEKHVHPLQLDVIDRLVELYSNPKEVVLTPFMGVGSEVYSPVRLGRKAIGIELKDTYYKQAVKNLVGVKVENQNQLSLI